MQQQIKNVLTLWGVLFLLTVLQLTYLQFFSAESLRTHTLNRRNMEEYKNVARGSITDRTGIVLATSHKGNDNRYVRDYPEGEAFSHITGFISSKLGHSGVEQAYNQYLTGIADPLRNFGIIDTLQANKSGYDVKLTVDAGAQRVAYRNLSGRRGAVIALNPQTGEILTLVSSPSYDPNTVQENWDTLSKDTRSILLNRATQGLYPPGSVVKPLIAASALEDKIITPNDIFQCNGWLKIGPDYELVDFNRVAHGKLNIDKALVVSCNSTFAQLALKIGRAQLGEAYKRFAFYSPPTLDLPLEKNRMPEFGTLSDGDLAQIAIGQSSLLVTPLQMAMVAAAFANKGTIMQPMLVNAIVSKDKKIIKQFSASSWHQTVSVHTAELVKNMMHNVVTNGTGRSASIRGVELGGKTGTAENPHGASHSWFIGFAPVDNPQIAIAVVVENAGTGSEAAAPIAKAVIEHLLK